jgi:hypothetical protein
MLTCTEVVVCEVVKFVDFSVDTIFMGHRAVSPSPSYLNLS